MLQPSPVKARAGVALASGGDVFMTGDVSDRVLLQNGRAQRAQCGVLGGFKRRAVEPLQLDADTVVIAVGAAPVAGSTGVPGALITAYKLPQAAVALDEKMRRHLKALDGLKVGVLLPVELVGEQLFHFRPTVLTRRQADAMKHEQINLAATWARAKVGRWAGRSKAIPASTP